MSQLSVSSHAQRHGTSSVNDGRIAAAAAALRGQSRKLQLRWTARRCLTPSDVTAPGSRADCAAWPRPVLVEGQLTGLDEQAASDGRRRCH